MDDCIDEIALKFDCFFVKIVMNRLSVLQFEGDTDDQVDEVVMNSD